MNCDSLGNRMKQYELLSDISLMRRVPILIRLDGKNFSNLTKRLKLEKPFDTRFLGAMAETMLHVASEIEGCIIGYTQSDEISLVLVNNQSLNSQPYFGNRVQKISSITASMATSRFNRKIMEFVGCNVEAYFDSRVFSVPYPVEAMNALIWRQQDCIRNSILSSAYYEIGKVHGRKTAQKMMHGLNVSELQELMFKEVGVNWSKKYEPALKNGTIVYKKPTEVFTPKGNVIRNKWVIEPAPIFQSDTGKKWLLDLLDPKDMET